MSDANTADSSNPPPPATGRPSRLRLIAAVVLPVAAIAVIAVLARNVADEPPPDPNAALPVPVAYQPGSASPSCVALDKALPAELSGLPRRTLVAEEPGVAAWGPGPVVYRCGTQTPQQLTCSSGLTQVDGVAWLQLSEEGLSTYFAVDRNVRIALTLPDGSGTGPIQALSDVIKATLPAREPCLDGVLLDTEDQGIDVPATTTGSN